MGQKCKFFQPNCLISKAGDKWKFIWPSKHPKYYQIKDAKSVSRFPKELKRLQQLLLQQKQQKFKYYISTSQPDHIWDVPKMWYQHKKFLRSNTRALFWIKKKKCFKKGGKANRTNKKNRVSEPKMGQNIQF